MPMPEQAPLETARGLLAHVFAQAREVLERSPEQVGSAVGMSGRTVRRLENTEDEQRPRRATLQTLAGYYGLDVGFVSALADWDQLRGEPLATRLAQLAGGEDPPEGNDAMRSVALRLARGSSTRSMAAGGAVPAALAESEEWGAMVELFVGLDARRRRLLVSVAREMFDAAGRSV